MKKSMKKALTCIIALALLLSPVISSSTSGNSTYQINYLLPEIEMPQ